MSNLHISIKAEPVFHLGKLVITNSLLSTWFLVAGFIFFASQYYKQQQQSKPSKLVLAVDMILEGLLGVFETMVVKAPNSFIAALKFILSRAVFVVNSSTLQEAQQSHVRTAELFEQLNPKELIKKYRIEGRIGMQLFVSEKTKKNT